MAKDRFWLYVAILSFVLALFWVGVSAATSLRKSSVPADVEKAATSLDPNIDQSIFSDLGKRKGVVF